MPRLIHSSLTITDHNPFTTVTTMAIKHTDKGMVMTNPILNSLILATPFMATSHTVYTELPCLQIHNHNVMHLLSLASGVTRSVIMLIIVPTATHNHIIIVAIILSLRCHHSLSHTLSINIHNLNSKFNLLEIHNLPDLSGKLIILP